MRRVCDHCHGLFNAETGRVNRADAIGAHLYCGRKCAGLARRSKVPKTDAQKRLEKAAYDASRRLAKADEIKAAKRAHYQANRESILAQMAAARPARMAAHVEYCRRPEYRAKKSEYDRRRRADKQFGEFSEAFLLLQDVDTEIAKRASKYEIGLSNGTINKAQMRRRSL